MGRVFRFLWILVIPVLLAMDCGSNITPPENSGDTFEYYDFQVDRFGTVIQDICYTENDTDPDNYDLVMVGEGGRGFLIDNSDDCHVLFLMVEADLSGVSNWSDNRASVVGERLLDAPAPLMFFRGDMWKGYSHPAQGDFTDITRSTACTDLGEIVQSRGDGSFEADVLFQTPENKPLTAIAAGLDPEDPVFAVGPNGTAFHREPGGEFFDRSIEDGPDFADVLSDCSSFGDVCASYAVGESEIWRFEGGFWSQVYEGSGGELRDIAFNHLGSVTAVGSAGTYLEHDGSNWNETSLGADLDLIAVAFGLTGTIDILSSDGRHLTWGVDSWRDRQLFHREDWSDLHGVDGGMLYAASGDSLLRGGAGGWELVSMTPFGEKLREIHVESDNQIYAIAGEEGGIDDFLYLYDGAAWQVQHHSSFDLFTSIWSDGDALLVSLENGSIWRHLGIEWEWMDADGMDINDLDGDSLENLRAVGEDGLILRYHEDGWIEEARGGETLLAISGPVAVGEGGAIRLREGSTWHAVDSGLDARLNDVWYGSYEEIWAVGENATCLRYDGESWIRLVTHLPGVDFLVVHESSSGRIWIGGSDGHLLRD